MLLRLRHNKVKSDKRNKLEQASDEAVRKYNKDLQITTSKAKLAADRLSDTVRKNGFTIKIHMAAGGKRSHAN